MHMIDAVTDFNCLTRFVELVDAEIEKVTAHIRPHKDENKCDYGEYFIGLGFVAFQRYIASVYPYMNLKKEEALGVGPFVSENLSLARALNVGANYWKHEPEWPFVFDIDGVLVLRDFDGLDRFSQNTVKNIEKLTPWADYTLANLLAGILGSFEFSADLSFSPLLPKIQEWTFELQSLPASS